jgi:hypothetical protein
MRIVADGDFRCVFSLLAPLRRTWTTRAGASTCFGDDGLLRRINEALPNRRYQVPGAQYLYSGRTYEFDGFEPHWRGIYDNKGRVVVAICNDMDLGDSWEWADEPRYDEKFSAMGFRIAANYLVYSMTH